MARRASATEMLFTLGDQIVAVTHKSDYPAEALDMLQETKQRLV